MPHDHGVAVNKEVRKYRKDMRVSNLGCYFKRLKTLIPGVRKRLFKVFVNKFVRRVFEYER